MALGADLQRVNQAAGVAADRTSLLGAPKIRVNPPPPTRTKPTRTGGRRNTHGSVHFGDVEQLVSALGGHGQSDGQVQQFDGEGPC